MNQNRRYIVESSNEPATLEFRYKVYEIDDTFEGYLRFADVMQDNTKDFKDVLAVALGKEQAEEIIATNPRISEINEITVIIGAAMKGISPEAAKKKIQEIKK